MSISQRSRPLKGQLVFHLSGTHGSKEKLRVPLEVLKKKESIFGGMMGATKEESVSMLMSGLQSVLKAVFWWGIIQQVELGLKYDE